jgi:hypothetical protein
MNAQMLTVFGLAVLIGHCCVDRSGDVKGRLCSFLRVRSPRRVRRARLYSELAGPGLDTEFVVAAAQVLHERVTAGRHRRAAIGLETAHRSQSGLESAVVALEAVVRVSLCVVESTGDQLLDHRLQHQHLGQVADHLVGLAMSSQSGAEEPAGRGNLTTWRGEHVDDLTVLAYSALDVAPSAGDLT